MTALLFFLAAAASSIIGWLFGKPKAMQDRDQLVEMPDHSLFNAILLSGLTSIVLIPVLVFGLSGLIFSGDFSGAASRTGLFQFMLVVVQPHILLFLAPIFGVPCAVSFLMRRVLT